MSQSDLKRIRKRYVHKGVYHAQEVQLNRIFSERRAQKHRVTGRWLKENMKHILKNDLPEVDTTNKFGDKWLNNFCRRFRISWQKRTNKKNKGVLKRLHIAKNYHWWVIHKMGMEKPHDMVIRKKKTKKKTKKKQPPKKKKKSKKKEDKPLFVRPPPLPKLIAKKKR